MNASLIKRIFIIKYLWPISEVSAVKLNDDLECTVKCKLQKYRP